MITRRMIEELGVLDHERGYLPNLVVLIYNRYSSILF